MKPTLAIAVPIVLAFSLSLRAQTETDRKSRPVECRNTARFIPLKVFLRCLMIGHQICQFTQSAMAASLLTIARLIFPPLAHGQGHGDKATMKGRGPWMTVAYQRYPTMVATALIHLAEGFPLLTHLFRQTGCGCN